LIPWILNKIHKIFIYHFKKLKIIRNNNLPATIDRNGKMEWYKNGIKQKEGKIDAGNIKG